MARPFRKAKPGEASTDPGPEPHSACDAASVLPSSRDPFRRARQHERCVTAGGQNSGDRGLSGRTSSGRKLNYSGFFLAVGNESTLAVVGFDAPLSIRVR
jgi:hypothetical protein